MIKYINPKNNLSKKRGTMKKLSYYLVLFSILLAFASLGQLETGLECFTDEDCDIFDNGEDYYCDELTGFCLLNETVAVIEETETETNSLTTIEDRVLSLEGELASLKASLSSLTNDFNFVKSELNTIETEADNLKMEYDQLASSNDELSTQADSVASGLAILQKDVKETKSVLEELQGSGGLTIVLIVLAVALALGIYFIVKKKGGMKKITPEIIHYITEHIKVGKKLPHIKENLQKAGWKEQDIHWAYKETIKHNYNQFKKAVVPSQAGKVAKPAKSPISKNKVIGVAIVSFVLIFGLLFLISGVTTGKAIDYKKLVGGEEDGTTGKVEYTIGCTSPHILNPDGDGCCLDENNNAICDNLEGRDAGEFQDGKCTDNAQCPQAQLCINSQCSSILDIYGEEGNCMKICEINAVKFSTSDGEEYNVKPKTGSYTAAGALEWKVLESPTFCKGSRPVVPIRITKKNQGKILSEDVITLLRRDTSPTIKHPDFPNIGFTMKVDHIYYSCPEE